MPEDSGANEVRIRGYLEDHGGSVEDGGGRGLTDEMARELGVDKPATVSALLQEMERDGVITREMRGLRTYRIALVDARSPQPTGVAAAATAGNGTGNASGGRSSHRVSLPESHMTEPTPSQAPPAPVAKAVSLRDALARKSAGVPPAAAADPVPPAAAGADSIGPDRPADMGAGAFDLPAGTVVSLREALSRPATKAPPTGPITAPPPPPPVAADAEWRRPQAGASAAPGTVRARSLRDAIAGDIDTTPSPLASPAGYEGGYGSGYDGGYGSGYDGGYEAPSGGQFTSLRDTARPAPIPDAGPAWDNGSGAGGSSRKGGGATKAGRGPRTRPRLSVPVPEVKTAPSATIITAVGVSLAGLVLVAVITAVFARGTTHQVIDQGSSSNDSCNVVTPTQAAVAFGGISGPPNYVLGTCVYDDGTHELIVEVYRHDGKGLFNAARTTSAITVPNLGDGAFYDGGELRVLQGSDMLEITLGPVPTAAPAPSLIAAANLAVARMGLPAATG